MSEAPNFFDVMRLIIFWLSPAILLEGLLLLFLTVDEYKKLEKVLSKEMGGFRKKRIPKIETNIYAFYDWLLKRKIVVALICIICALIFFLLLKR